MAEKLAAVKLRKGEGRTIKAGGAWIFDNEIDTVDGNPADGDLVSVADFDGYPMGTGFINSRSKIRVRMMTRNPKQAVDRAFLAERVKNAIDYRRHTTDMSCCRLIFGEADFLPGLVIDKFSDVLVVESLALGIDRLKPAIIGECKKQLAELGMPIRGVYERSDAKVRRKEGMEPSDGFVGDEFDPMVEITENGVKYRVNVAEGQKTGYFLDQKMNRLAIRPMAAGSRVLDCFTHTGSFALNAAAAGAVEVLGADASDLAIAQAEENAKLNGFEDRVKFQCCDIFDLLPSLEQKGEKYDLVILDPPAFTKSRSSVRNAVKGYREINLRGMKLVRDGGFLATCSCSHFMDPELFAKTIGQAARDVHVRLRQVYFGTQAPDHPILWTAGEMESYYLKFYIFQVCEER